MTAKKYLLDLGFDDEHLPELFNDDDKSYYSIAEIMESYHQDKLKLLGIGSSASFYECKCDQECKHLDCSVIKCKQGNKK